MGGADPAVGGARECPARECPEVKIWNEWSFARSPLGQVCKGSPSHLSPSSPLPMVSLSPIPASPRFPSPVIPFPGTPTPSPPTPSPFPHPHPRHTTWNSGSGWQTPGTTHHRTSGAALRTLPPPTPSHWRCVPLQLPALLWETLSLSWLEVFHRARPQIRPDVPCLPATYSPPTRHLLAIHLLPPHHLSPNLGRFNYIRARPASAVALLAAYGDTPAVAVDAALQAGRRDVAEM